jgi:membrane protease YdiL (CAAX protease family)
VDLWLLVFFLAVIEPIVGWYRFRRLAARSGPLATAAKLRLYAFIVGMQWVLVAACAWVLARRGLALADLGLRGPPPVLAVMAAALLAGSLVGGALASLRALARLTDPGRLGHLQKVARILPASGGERAAFVVVALTAGVCEEILYRGFLIYALGGALHSTWVALAVAAVFFGGAHAYQGPRGVATTGLLGAILGGLYVLCGSLWPGIGLHAVVDLANGFALGRLAGALPAGPAPTAAPAAAPLPPGAEPSPGEGPPA